MHEDVNDIIQENTGLIYRQLHKFHLVDDPDAISYGFEALYKAIETYDSSSGVKFSTYASVCIYNALGCYVRSLHKKIRVNTVSYNNLVDDTELSYEDMLGTHESAEDTVMNKMAVDGIYSALEELRQSYSGNCRKVFDVWYESQFEYGQGKIAEILGISQPYVSTILSRIRKDFKNKMEENK